MLDHEVGGVSPLGLDTLAGLIYDKAYFITDLGLYAAVSQSTWSQCCSTPRPCYSAMKNEPGSWTGFSCGSCKQTLHTGVFIGGPGDSLTVFEDHLERFGVPALEAVLLASELLETLRARTRNSKPRS